MRPLELQARERKLVLLHVTRRLALARHALEPRDRALALDPGRIAGRQVLDQARDAIPDLKREVGGRRSNQLPDVLDGDAAAGREPVGALGAAQSDRLLGAALTTNPVP